MNRKGIQKSVLQKEASVSFGRRLLKKCLGTNLCSTQVFLFLLEQIKRSVYQFVRYLLLGGGFGSCSGVTTLLCCLLF